jgi:hypothetical protein
VAHLLSSWRSSFALERIPLLRTDECALRPSPASGEASSHPSDPVHLGLGPDVLAEVFQQTRVIDRFTDSPALAAFRLARDLRLLDLTGAWPTLAGASMAISSGSRSKARAWSRAIYVAYPQIEGLRYASSMNANQPAFALYERARSALPAVAALDLPLAAPALMAPLAAAAVRFGYALI